MLQYFWQHTVVKNRRWWILMSMDCTQYERFCLRVAYIDVFSPAFCKVLLSSDMTLWQSRRSVFPSTAFCILLSTDRTPWQSHRCVFPCIVYSNDMTSWQSHSTEKISCNVAPFFYHHSRQCGGDHHLASDTLYQTGYLSLISKKNVNNVRLSWNIVESDVK